jgi:hypothetical protein
MRWQQLFADLQAQFDEQETAAERAEWGSRARAEIGSVTLVERLGGSLGSSVSLRCRGAGPVVGRLVEVGPDWLLLVDDHARPSLVALGAVRAVGGLGRRTAVVGDPGPVRARLDYVEVAEHPVDEPRRAEAVLGVRTVVIAGIALVRSGPAALG